MYPSSDGRDIQFLNLCGLDVVCTIQFLSQNDKKEPNFARGLLFICAKNARFTVGSVLLKTGIE